MNAGAPESRGGRSIPLWLECLGWCLLYYLAGIAGLSLAGDHENVTFVWPPSGIALAVLLIRGRRCWPAVAMGAFLVNISNTGAIGLSLGIAVGNLAEALIGQEWIRRYAQGRNPFDKVSSTLAFILGASLVAPLVGAALGSASLFAAGQVASRDLPDVWVTWFLGDLCGIVTLGAFLVTWLGGARALRSRVTGRREAVALGLVTLLLGMLAFRSILADVDPYPVLALACLPPLLWASFRFEARGTTACVTLFGMIAAWSAMARAGTMETSALQHSLFVAQSYIGVGGITGLILAAAATERSAHEDALLEERRSLERRVEERTREAIQNAQRFRALFDRAPDAMVMVDASRIVRLANDQVERIFGIHREEIVGHPIEGLIPARFRASHPEHMARYFANPLFRPMGSGLRLYGQRKNGEEFPVEISLSPFQTEDGTVALASIRDISERRLLEEKEQALLREQSARAEAEAAVKAREGFLAIASHELSTPLAALKLQLSNLVRTIERTGAESISAERMLTVLTGLARMTRRIQTLVTGMLDVSRVQTGQFHLKCETMDLAVLVREVWDRYRPEIELSGSRVELDVPESICGNWDRERMDQVVTNLLINALRYGERKPICLRARRDGDVAWFAVSDQGRGIPEDAREEIFSAFRQGPGPGHERGLGLGLYIVREIVNGHGGEVRVTSDVGKGSTFTVSLPCSDVPQPRPEPRSGDTVG